MPRCTPNTLANSLMVDNYLVSMASLGLPTMNGLPSTVNPHGASDRVRAHQQSLQQSCQQHGGLGQASQRPKQQSSLQHCQPCCRLQLPTC